MARVDIQPKAGDDFLDGVFGVVIDVEMTDDDEPHAATVCVNFGRTHRNYHFNDLEWSEKLDCWYPLQ